MLASMKAAAGVAVLALSASLVAVQVGRGPAEPGAFSASEPASWVTVTGTQQPGRPGNPYQATNTTTDPRVDGDVRITWDAATEAPGVIRAPYALSGTVTITNDDGTWQGQFIGFVDDQGRHHSTVWYEGTGDYDGLRYLEQLAQPEPEASLDVTGLIFDGPIPSTVVPPEMEE